MKDESIRRLRWIYGIFTAIWTGLVGALFIVQVWSIYGSAESEQYTTAIIREKFSQIAVFVWIWVATVVVGGIGSWIFPEAEARPKAYVSTQKTLLRLKGLLPENGEHWSAIYRRQVLRFIVYAVVGCFCAVVTALCAAWLLGKGYTPVHDSSFFQEGNAISDRLLRMLPWAGAAMAAAAAAAVFRAISLQKECSYVKAQIAASKRQPQAATEAPTERSAKEAQRAKQLFAAEKKYAEKKKAQQKKQTNPLSLLIVRCTLGVCAVALIIGGICNGGMTDVLDKAIKICTQCIGLG